jgi:ribose transport system permease protein
VYIFAGWQSASFFTWNNNVNLFGRVTPLILAGLAQTAVILTGGIDLSVGSMIGVASVTAASLPYVDTPVNLALWILVPPLVGLAMGAMNGLLIAKWPFPPFVVTLASSSVYFGLALSILPEPGGEVSLDATLVASGKIHGVPIPLLLMLAVVAAAHLLLSRTRIGRSIYALGGNETLAIQSGIRPGRVKFFVYSLSGLFSGLAGAYLSAWMFAGDPLVGEPYVMNSIAVAVIGGSSLMGGRGGVLGVIGGAYIFYLINNVLNLLGINAFYQYIAKGAILIAALAVSAPDLLQRLGLAREGSK